MRHRHHSIAVLIPAHNEASSIAATLTSLLAQERPAELIIVSANGCDDATVDIARTFPSVVVLDLPALPHRKSEALNIAWREFARDADLVVCVDADTELPPNALRDWEQEFKDSPELGGSRAKFTMRGRGLLTRLQRAEYAQGVDTSLRRGWTSILAGAGCMFRNELLREVADERGAPWCYESLVEDYELTYQLRLRGHATHVSPTVRAYTDSMKSVRALWAQRMKWQAGTAEDLLRFGYNRVNRFDWGQQAIGLVCVSVRALWLVLTGLALLVGGLKLEWYWLLFPVLYVAINVRAASRIPHRDRWDIALAVMIVPYEVFSTLQMAWFVKGWADVLAAKLFRRSRNDRWAAQYLAEGK